MLEGDAVEHAALEAGQLRRCAQFAGCVHGASGGNDRDGNDVDLAPGRAFSSQRDVVEVGMEGNSQATRAGSTV